MVLAYFVFGIPHHARIPHTLNKKVPWFPSLLVLRLSKGRREGEKRRLRKPCNDKQTFGVDQRSKTSAAS
jgi:hypothetical protein